MNAEIWQKSSLQCKARFASLLGYDHRIQNKCSKIKGVKAISPKISPIFALILDLFTPSPNRPPPFGGCLKNRFSLRIWD